VIAEITSLVLGSLIYVDAFAVITLQGKPYLRMIVNYQTKFLILTSASIVSFFVASVFSGRRG
jgi:hypothetical protein